MALRNSFTEVLHKIGKEDPKLVVLVGDISHYRMLAFNKDCPGRYFNVGICEPTIVNMAAGISKSGLFPVVHTISPFIVERSFEQIKLDFCYQGFGGNIMTAGSAFDYAYLGCTHHCYSDFALLKTLPNTQLLYPASDSEFEKLFRQTYRNSQLTFSRLPSSEHGFKFYPDEIEFGKGIKMQEGKDLTIIAVGTQLKSALEAIPELKTMGVSVELIYLHTVKPIDSDLIYASLKKTSRCLVIEEHGVYGGVYDDVLRLSTGLAVQYASIAIPNQFIREYGTYELHCQRLGLTKEGVINKVKQELFRD